MPKRKQTPPDAFTVVSLFERWEMSSVLLFRGHLTKAQTLRTICRQWNGDDTDDGGWTPARLRNTYTNIIVERLRLSTLPA